MERSDSKKPLISFSQAGQDNFVMLALGGKRDGSFLEIGASDAISLSNTYLLEREFGWFGLSVDISLLSKLSFWKAKRESRLVLGDATKLDYGKHLRRHNFPKTLDYLSLDIEPMTNTLRALGQVLASGFRFRVITYETDFYDPATARSQAEHVQSESRGLLAEAGYTLVAGDVCATEGMPFEDWWVDSREIDKKTMSAMEASFSPGQLGTHLVSNLSLALQD